MSKGLEIFRAGNWLDVSGQDLTFSTDDLRATAEAYDPAQFRAPLVVGHPALNDPAYGWVASVRLDGDRLIAEPERVEPQFAALVNGGQFPKISASFFHPSARENPKPGTWYLRHVGFLGAAAPGVPGLKEAHFAAAGEGVVVIEFASPALAITPQEPLMGQKTPETADFAAQQAALDQRAADLAAREQALKDKEQAARQADIVAFAAQLVTEGRVLPRDESALVAFMGQVDDRGTVAFAAPDGTKNQTPASWLREFLSRLPQQVDFSEHRPPADPITASADFAAPAGYAVAQDRLALHNRITAYQRQHGVDYATAAAAIGD